MEPAFLKIYFSIFAGALALIAITNWAIDPYLLFNSPAWASINMHKTESDNRQRLSKAYDVIRKNPATLILGNSRSLYLANNYPAWKNKPVYQYALTSANIYEILRYFQHATNSHQVKEAILGLDFGMFIPGGGHPEQFNEDRLLVNYNADLTPTSHRLIAYLKDSLPALLSLNALNSSIRTIQSQDNPPMRYDEGKIAVCENPSWNHDRVREKGGSRAFFLQLSRDFLSDNALSDKHKHAMQVVNREANWDGYAYYTALLKLAYENNITLHLYISPTHAMLEEDWQIAGFSSRKDEWLKNIVLINESIARKGHKTAYRFWDFSGYNSINTEKIPEIGDLDTPMHWYWEAAHYKAETGYLILDRLLGYQRDNCPVPSDFGINITSENIDEHIKNKIKMREIYTKNHPELRQSLLDIMNELRSGEKPTH